MWQPWRPESLSRFSALGDRMTMREEVNKNAETGDLRGYFTDWSNRVPCWSNFLRPNWEQCQSSVAGTSMGIAELGDME